MLERKSLDPRGSERLSVRRRRGRVRALIVLGLVLLLCCAGFLYLSWQPSMRVKTLTIVPDDPQIHAIVERELSGTVAYLAPRNSFFFIPEHAIRAAILAERPDIQAVSISHEGIAGLTVAGMSRVAVASWCGLSHTEGVPEYCYFFDANGYVFQAADTASSTPTLYPFILYAPLVGDSEEPMRANIKDAHALPTAFDFARQVGNLGSPVLSLMVKDDEITCFLQSGTKITYVIGHEQEAFTNLTSSKNNIDLASGAVEYVDLRFDSKVYVKNKSSE